MNNQQAAVTTTDNSAIIASQIASQEPGKSEKKSDPSVIETRFGTINVPQKAPLVFNKGILGMPEKNQFTLVDFPIEKFQQFKLLQSLDDHELSFIALPIKLENPLIDKIDLEEACKELNFDISDLAVMLIVSVHREVNQVRLSVNTRAPILMDASLRIAEQYVLRNNKYVVRHMIST